MLFESIKHSRMLKKRGIWSKWAQFDQYILAMLLLHSARSADLDPRA